MALRDEPSGRCLTLTGQSQDTAGVITRPPVVYGGFVLLGIVLDYVWPLSFVAHAGRYLVGFLLIALGLVIMTLCLRQFRKAGTPHKTSQPTVVLVTSGLFQYSRNPIYVSLALIHAGMGIAANNPWIVGLLVPALAVIRYGVIAREERYLERKFGSDYLQYKASVPRWL